MEVGNVPKIRVHELAKELKITTKELINIMSKHNIENKKTMSNVTEEEVVAVKRFFENSRSLGKDEDQPKNQEEKKKYPQSEKKQEAVSSVKLKQEAKMVHQNQESKPNISREDSARPQQGRQENRTYTPRTDGVRPQQGRQENRAYTPRTDGARPQQGRQENRTYTPRTDGVRPQQGRQENRTYTPRTDGVRPQQGRQENRTYTPRTDGVRPQQGRQENRAYTPRTDGARPQQGRQENRAYTPRTDGVRPQQGRQENRAYTPRTDGVRPQQGRQENRTYTPRTDGVRPQYNNKPSRGYPYDKSNDKNQFNKNTNQIEVSPFNKDRRNFKDKQKQSDHTKHELRRTGKVIKQRGVVEEPKITATQKKKDKRKILQKQMEEKLLREQEASKAAENDIKVIQVGKGITVKDLAAKLNRPVQDVIMPLMKIGIMANVNQEIDFYTATKIAEDYDIIVEALEEEDLLNEAFGAEDEDDEASKVERSPVVVVMGHVDHGKTSLLDAIRKANVTEGEAGGITQHIGAYQVLVSDKSITFLDTTGHEAFTAMRMRGAQVTDIAILVVAADDGVMPQTIEAINHAKAADVEIIVAINKIDKPQANLDRVKQELSDHGLLTEDWGGSTICVPVSARNRIGIDDLLESILLAAEINELKANPNKRAKGTVIEANLDKGKGPVATVLIQDGTLSIGDPVVVGATHGKVRAMMDYKGNRVKKAGPSTPVEIIGLSSVPKAGDLLYVAASDKQAGQVAANMVAKGREAMLKSTSEKISLDDLFDQIKAGNVKGLNIVIKADVQGSVEALRNSLERLSNDEVRIRTIHGGVGQVTESDIMLASASNAIIIGFNVRYDNSAKQIADAENVDIRLYRIIYNAIEDISSAMKGLLDPIFKESIVGHGEIRQLFKASGVAIAGSYITDGKVTRNSKVRVTRDGKVIYEGVLAALRRFKDDVKEVAHGYECGLSFEKFNDLKEGDKIEAYVMEEVPR